MLSLVVVFVMCSPCVYSCPWRLVPYSWGLDPCPWRLGPCSWRLDPCPWKLCSCPWRPGPCSWGLGPCPWRLGPCSWGLGPCPWRFVLILEGLVLVLNGPVQSLLTSLWEYQTILELSTIRDDEDDSGDNWRSVRCAVLESNHDHPHTKDSVIARQMHFLSPTPTQLCQSTDGNNAFCKTLVLKIFF